MNKQYERLSSLMLAFVLAIGVLVAWYLVSVIPIGPFWAKLRYRGGSEELYVLQDGTPVIYSWMPANKGCRTLNGRPAPNFKATDNTWGGVVLFGPEWKKLPYSSTPWRVRIIMLMEDTIPPGAERLTELCYFVQNGRSDGRAYFVYYDRENWMCTGYLGRNGFSRTKPNDNEQFRVDSRRLKTVGQSYVLDYVCHFDSLGVTQRAYISANLLTDEGVYEIDYCRHAVKLLFPNDTLCSASSIKATPVTFSLPPTTPPPPQLLIVRTPDRVIILSESGEPLRSYLLPKEIRDKDFRWFDFGDGKAMLTIDRNGLPTNRMSSGEKTASIYWFGDDGKVVDHREVVLKTTKGTNDAAVNMLCVPSPMIQFLGPVLDSVFHRRVSSSASVYKKIANQWPWIMILAIVCIVLAWLCYRRQRRFGLPWTWMWVVFVLLLGVPGWLGYLVHRRWPARLPCPHCGKSVPRDRPACLHCSHDFPAPAPTGAEVFA